MEGDFDPDFDPIGEGKIDINDEITDEDINLLPTQRRFTKNWKKKIIDLFKSKKMELSEQESRGLFKKKTESFKRWGDRIRNFQQISTNNYKKNKKNMNRLN